MTDYKRLSENTFNIQAKTYDTDKNGKHARNLYQYVIDSLSTLKFLEILADCQPKRPPVPYLAASL